MQWTVYQACETIGLPTTTLTTMLILSRKTDEKIVIRDDIVVTVLAIDGDKVKIGISAPREIQVYRHEIWQAIQEQNRTAGQPAQAESPDGFDDLRSYLL